MPFTVPKTYDLSEYIDLDSMDLSEYGHLSIDGEPIEMYDLQYFIANTAAYFQGEKYTFKTILGGALGGKTIAVGDKLHILLKLKESEINQFKDAKGKHELKIESDKIPNVVIKFELHDKNMNIKFDPTKL